MAALPRNIPTVARLGYEGLSAAVSQRHKGLRVEIGLVVPGHAYGDDWTVVEHVDCDPADPSRGTSGVQGFTTREEAEAEFSALATRVGYDLVHPCYAVAADRKRGGKAFLGRDAVGGFPCFLDENPSGKDMFPDASGASSAVAGTNGLKTYHGAAAIDFATFAAHEARVRTKRVEIDGSRFDIGRVHPDVGSNPVAPPAGWRFAVCDALQTSFVAPQGHWAKLGSVLAACPFGDLAGAVAATRTAGDGYDVVLIRHEVEDAPLPAADLVARAAEEKEARPMPTAVQQLDDVDAYRPFG